MARQVRPRIASVTISRLFGVPGDLEVSFMPLRAERPVSAIIFGENGSGKSSIAKAIEWAVQNRVNRSPVLKHSPKNLFINLRSITGSATVTLSDGTQLSRHATWDPEDESFSFAGTEPPTEFTRSPILLTRADILTFITSPPAARGRVFLDYALLEGGSEAVQVENAALKYLDQEILDYKRQIRAAAVPIAEHLDHPAPYELPQITALIDDLFKGVPRNRRGQVRIPRRLEPVVTRIEELQKQLAMKTKNRERVKRQAGRSATRRIAELKATLGDVDSWLTGAFREITGSEHVSEIHVELGESSASALDIRVQIEDRSYSERIFSEGYQDLLAMLFFLVTARVTAAHGQVPILILDDVLQSVDAHIRVALMQFILREFKDWQLLVTVHDRLWREQLHKLFQDAGMPIVSIELRDWSFGSGSHVDQPTRDPGAALRTVVTTRDPSAICALAGRLLEQICDILSWSIPVRVQRRRDDRYTLEDLWPGVASALQKTSAADCIRRVEGLRHLRNLVGAHHNEWAQTVTLSEAERFAAAVLELLDYVWCSKCKAWVQYVDRKTVRCPCATTELSPLRTKS